jgi:hypothetical protein
MAQEKVGDAAQARNGLSIIRAQRLVGKIGAGRD